MPCLHFDHFHGRNSNYTSLITLQALYQTESCVSFSDLHIFGLWLENGVPRGNPCRHRNTEHANFVQNGPRPSHLGINPMTFLLSGYTSITPTDSSINMLFKLLLIVMIMQIVIITRTKSAMGSNPSPSCCDATVLLMLVLYSFVVYSVRIVAVNHPYIHLCRYYLFYYTIFIFMA